MWCTLCCANCSCLWRAPSSILPPPSHCWFLFLSILISLFHSQVTISHSFCLFMSNLTHIIFILYFTFFSSPQSLFIYLFFRQSLAWLSPCTWLSSVFYSLFLWFLIFVSIFSSHPSHLDIHRGRIVWFLPRDGMCELFKHTLAGIVCGVSIVRGEQRSL